MKTHRIIHSGGVVMVTIPREIWREWSKRQASVVRIEWRPPALVVEPYTDRLDPCYPRPDLPVEAKRGRPADPA